MAGKVTNEQIQNMKPIAVEEFRKAVNVENPKNKGYVRFVPDGKDGVKIEKVNNKIDFKIGWRTNINATNNKAMREKFADAFKVALRWSNSAEVDRLLNSITKTIENEANIGALSRKEMETAFKTYDQMMNTVEGRKEMIFNLLQNAAEKCGFKSSNELINKNYLKLTEEHQKMFEVNSDTGALNKGELEFRAYLRSLERSCNDAVTLAKADEVVTSVVNEGITLVKDKGSEVDFGAHLSMDKTSEVRGVLLNYLQQKNLFEKDSNGTHQVIFEKFMTDVLPKLYEQGIKAMHNLDAGGGLNDGIDQRAVISLNTLLNEAEAFMAEAAIYLKNPPQFTKDVQLEIKTKEDVIMDDMLQNLKGCAKGAQKTAITSEVDIEMDLAGLSVNFEDGEKDIIKQELKNKDNIADFTAKGHLAIFTAKFLASRGIGEDIPEEKLFKKTLENTLKAVDETINKIKIGAQIQYGEKHVDPQTHTLKKSLGAGVYIQDMENAILQISMAKTFNAELLEKLLFTYTLPNIMNQKIEMATHGLAKNANLNTDEQIEAKDKELLKNTANACVDFEKTADKLITAEKKVFTNLLKEQQKKGLITEDQFSKMLVHVSDKIAEAHIAALTDFFRDSPVEDITTGKQKLTQIFKEKLNEVRAELKNELAMNTIDQATLNEYRANLKDINGRITEALSQANLPTIDMNGIISNEKSLQIIKNGALKRLYTNLLASHLQQLKTKGETPTIDQAFVNKLQQDFNKETKRLLETIAKHTKSLLSTCTTLIEEGARELLKGRVFEKVDKNTLPVTKDESNALVETVTKEVMMYKTSHLQKMIEKLLSAPESIEKKDVNALANDFVYSQGVESADKAFNDILTARETSVMNVLNKDGARKIIPLITAHEIFTSGGKLAHLGQNEREALAVYVAQAVEARAKMMPALYAAGKPETILQQMAQEAVQRLEKIFSNGWTKFHEKFQKDATTLNQRYSGLGEETIKKVYDFTLSELIRDKDFPKIDLKVALTRYEDELKAELEAEIETKKKELEAYKAQIEKVLRPTRNKWKNICLERFNKNLVEHLSPDACDYFNEILDKKWQSVQDHIYRDPYKFKVDQLEEHLVHVGSHFMNFVEKVIQANSFLKSDRIEGQLSNLGFEELLKAPNEKARAIDAIELLIGSEDGSAKLYEAEKALLDHLLTTSIVYVDSETDLNTIDPFTCVPENPENPVFAFRDLVCETIRGLTLSLLHDTFKQDKIGETREHFQEWLNTYELSRAKDYRSDTVHDKIMAKFDARVILLQQQIATNGNANEPILSSDFVNEITQIIDSEGATMAIKEWKDKLMTQWMSEFSQGNNWHLFDTKSTESTQLLPTITKNYEDLTSTLSTLLSTIAADVDHTGGIDELRKHLEAFETNKIFDKIKLEMDVTIERCINRYAFESNAENLVKTYMHSIERNLINAAIGKDSRELFPNGLSDLFSNLPQSTDLSLVGEAFNTITNAIINRLSAELESARMNEVFSLTTFTETLNRCSQDFITLTLDDQTCWKNVLEPVLKTISEEVK